MFWQPFELSTTRSANMRRERKTSVNGPDSPQTFKEFPL